MSANPRGVRMSRAERHELVVTMKGQGKTFAEISRLLGVARSTVTSAYYDPTGEQNRSRKEKYCGTCVDCGGRTAYLSEGSAERCRPCRVEYERDPRYRVARRYSTDKKWTDEQILAAVRSAAVDGAVSSFMYSKARECDPEAMPSLPLVVLRFGTWADAVETAGLERPTRKQRSDFMPVAGAWLAVEECEAAIGHVPSLTEYEEWAARVGAPCATIIRRRLGGWKNVLVRGLEAA